MTSMNHPDSFICLNPSSGWIRKEEYSYSNSFFDLDISNSYIDTKLKYILELMMSEFHSDKLIANIENVFTYIRVGEKDMNTHPWYSRRMYRLLKSQYEELKASNERALSSLPLYPILFEEIAGKDHWWWDTSHPNDGGVTNDAKLRKFYEQCTSNSKKEKILFSIDPNANHNNAGVAVSLTYTIINPTSSYSGKQGVFILQQEHSMQLSKINVVCKGNHFINRSCTIHTFRNVLRVRINVTDLEHFCYGVTQFRSKENIVILDISNNQSMSCSTNNAASSWENRNNLELCVKEGKIMACLEPIHPLREKSPTTAGPIRSLYRRPFLIVYGTDSLLSECNNNQVMKVTLRRLALYINLLHISAHDTFIHGVIMDEEYIENISMYQEYNLLFIGGMFVNKAMQFHCSNSFLNVQHNSSNDDVRTRYAAICYSPVEYKRVDDEPNDSLLYKQDKIDTTTCRTHDTDNARFQIDGRSFDSPTNGVLYTMPMIKMNLHGDIRDSKNSFDHWDDNGRLGVCLHANSARAYLHFSKFAWPVIPPMVRSPFANYMPDVVVVDTQKCLSQGWGGVLLAGMWSPSFGIDSETMFEYKG